MAITKNGSTFTGLVNALWANNWTSASFAVGANSNSILVVSVGVFLSAGLTDPCVTGVKWGGSGGTALTKLLSQTCNPTGTKELEASLWFLVAPTAQTSTLYLTFADSINEVQVSATVWDGAAQTTPFSGAVGGYNGWTTNHTITVSSATNSLVIDAINGGMVFTCSQTQDGNVSGSNSHLGQSNKAGAASVVMTWTTASNYNHAMVAASLAPYTGGGDHINIALAVGGS